MAYIYEINGQRVEFEKEPTEADIDEAARQLGAAPVPPPEEKSQLRQEAEGVGTMLAVPAAQALQTAIENPVKTALGAYGTYKTAQLANAGIEALKGMKTPPPATPAPVPTAPVAPTAPAAPATSPILDAQGRPMVRTPVAPSAPATPAPAPKAPVQTSVMDKASQVIRQLAANRVVQGAARIGGTVTAAVMPGNVGQNYPFPQSGPMRGQEINPSTGRPWTKQELDAYRAQYGG